MTGFAGHSRRRVHLPGSHRDAAAPSGSSASRTTKWAMASTSMGTILLRGRREGGGKAFASLGQTPWKIWGYILHAGGGASTVPSPCNRKPQRSRGFPKSRNRVNQRLELSSRNLALHKELQLQKSAADQCRQMWNNEPMSRELTGGAAANCFSHVQHSTGLEH